MQTIEVPNSQPAGCGLILQADIQRFAHPLMKDHPVFTEARAGRLTRRNIEMYLESIFFLVRHTPVCLRAARQRALLLQDIELATWFDQKLGEEQGHDQWALSDLANLRQRTLAPEDSRVLPSMVKIVQEITRIVDEDPKLYLGYILLAESLTVIAAPSWLDALETHCGIPRSCMSVVDRHVELDQDHMAEGILELSRLIPQELIPAMRSQLETFFGLFDAFYREVAAS